MRSPDENRRRIDPGFFANAAAHFGDLRLADEKSIEPDEGDDSLSVVEDSSAGLARIVESLMISFPVASRSLHPGRRRDVTLGKAGLRRSGGEGLKPGT